MRETDFDLAQSCCYNYTGVLLDHSKSHYFQILLFNVLTAFVRAIQSTWELKGLNTLFEALLIGKLPLIHNWRLRAC
jgi:hypothetical protein